MLKLMAVMLGVLLLTVSITTVVDMDKSAYGLTKAKGIKQVRHHTVNHVGNKVCGDQLCEGPSYFKRVN